MEKDAILKWTAESIQGTLKVGEMIVITEKAAVLYELNSSFPSEEEKIITVSGQKHEGLQGALAEVIRLNIKSGNVITITKYGAHISFRETETLMVTVSETHTPKIEVITTEATDIEVPKIDVPKTEVITTEATDIDVPKTDVPKTSVSLRNDEDQRPCDQPKTYIMNAQSKANQPTTKVTLFLVMFAFIVLTTFFVINVASLIGGYMRCHTYSEAAFINSGECVRKVAGFPFFYDRGDGPFAINHAAGLCHVYVFKELLEVGIDPTTDDNYALRHASKNGCFEVVRLLLKDPRVDVNAKDGSSLLHAVANGHTIIVKELLKDPRVDATLGRLSALKVAYNFHNTEIYSTLMQDSRINQSIKIFDGKTFRDFMFSLSEKDHHYAMYSDCK